MLSVFLPHFKHNAVVYKEIYICSSVVCASSFAQTVFPLCLKIRELTMLDEVKNRQKSDDLISINIKSTFLWLRVSDSALSQLLFGIYAVYLCEEGAHQFNFS